MFVMGVNINHIPSTLTKSLSNYKSLSMDSLLIFQIQNHAVNEHKFIFCFPVLMFSILNHCFIVLARTNGTIFKHNSNS